MVDATHQPVPDFPRMLAGGPETLRLTWTGVWLLTFTGAAIQIATVFVAGTMADPMHQLATAAALLVGALLTAAIAARWLGEPLGITAGVFQLSGFWAIRAFSGACDSEPLVATLATAMLGLFAWANVPGRRPSNERFGVRSLFYVCGASLLCLGGLGPWIALLLASLAYLLWNQDGRAFRFLVHPAGLALLVLTAGYVAWRDRPMPPPITWDGSALLDPLTGMLPWTPFVAAAVAIGCWRGYDAVLFWRLAACWIIVPPLLAAGHWFPAHLATAVVVAPLSMLSAAGLYEIVLFARFWRRRKK
ncbi:MAG: hypothetical protein ABFC77_14500 [Thermoguttaceae bacterium]